MLSIPLLEMHAIRVKSSLNCETKASPTAPPEAQIFVWKLCGIVPKIITIEAFNFGQIFLLTSLAIFWFGLIFHPFSILFLSNQCKFFFMLTLG